jgi:hypothetical protein
LVHVRLRAFAYHSERGTARGRQSDRATERGRDKNVGVCARACVGVGVGVGVGVCACGCVYVRMCECARVRVHVCVRACACVCFGCRYGHSLTAFGGSGLALLVGGMTMVPPFVAEYSEYPSVLKYLPSTVNVEYPQHHPSH